MLSGARARVSDPKAYSRAHLGSAYLQRDAARCVLRQIARESRLDSDGLAAEVDNAVVEQMRVLRHLHLPLEIRLRSRRDRGEIAARSRRDRGEIVISSVRKPCEAAGCQIRKLPD